MSKDTNLPAQGTKTHQYASAGVYQVVIADEDNTARSKNFTVVIPFGPVMTVREDPTDAARRSVRVVVDNAGEGNVVIDWGDNTPRSNNAGDNTAESRHRYANAGVYTITASDADEPTRYTTAEVTVPFTVPVPTPTVTPAPADATGMTASLLVDNHGNGAVNVDWGDGTPAGTNPGDNTTATTHQYATAGTYTITATDPNNSQVQGQTTYIAPTAPPPPAPTVTPSEDNSDGTGMTVSVLVNNHGNGPTTVDWGDSTATGTNPGDNTTPTTHQYATAGTYTITATSNAGGPPGTASVTMPMALAPVVTPSEDASDASGQTVSVLVDNHGGGTVNLDWGDSTAAGTNPGDNTTPTTHQYATAGTYTITATSNAGGPPGTAAVTLPFDPAPVLTMSPDANDATSITVSSLTDGHGGGDATVDRGNSTPTTASKQAAKTPRTATRRKTKRSDS